MPCGLVWVFCLFVLLNFPECGFSFFFPGLHWAIFRSFGAPDTLFSISFWWFGLGCAMFPNCAAVILFWTFLAVSNRSLRVRSVSCVGSILLLAIPFFYSVSACAASIFFFHFFSFFFSFFSHSSSPSTSCFCFLSLSYSHWVSVRIFFFFFFFFFFLLIFVGRFRALWGLLNFFS